MNHPRLMDVTSEPQIGLMPAALQVIYLERRRHAPVWQRLYVRLRYYCHLVLDWVR
jgi:hypothetical protein